MAGATLHDRNLPPGREDVRPRQARGSPKELAAQGVGQIDLTASRGELGAVAVGDAVDLGAEAVARRGREEGGAIVVALGAAPPRCGASPASGGTWSGPRPSGSWASPSSGDTSPEAVASSLEDIAMARGLPGFQGSLKGN